MEIIKAINLAAAFFLEIAMLIAFAYFGFQYPENTILKYVMMIALPVAAIILWGYFARAKIKTPSSTTFSRFICIDDVWSSYLSINMIGKTMLAAIFAIMVIINQLLLFILKQ
jgi:hypothetical protein